MIQELEIPKAGQLWERKVSGGYILVISCKPSEYQQSPAEQGHSKIYKFTILEDNEVISIETCALTRWHHYLIKVADIQ